VSAANILVVDDEPTICEMLYFMLGDEGYRVSQALNAGQALDHLHRQVPDIVLVDWMMPGMSGIDLVRNIRANPVTRDLPIIMVTAKTDEQQRVAGLSAGADDYVTKPFFRRELSARIRALLRRTKPHKGLEKITVGAMVLDPAEHRLEIGGKAVAVGPTEFQLLHFLAARPGQVFARRRILDGVWGLNRFVEERTVDVYVRRLRKTLAPHGFREAVATVRGVGYCFRPPE